ncbi:assimilatory sulfite reductase (NADPH) hemoprotein subunit [Buchnera aphidicola]|uniref:assimilatory sulfite reductase (NADPH) hemoprotein subunit n=1 Tax=Buchnera aphidicola TaxID=9 RepID=UPI00346425E2
MKEKKNKKLYIEGKLTDFERIKMNSNYLRGTINEDLKDCITNGFNGDNFSLIRFHGMYQQDDRDIRLERIEQKLEPRYAIMLRCRLPAGVITTNQWLKIDKFATEKTLYRTIRLTNRQTFQFHGIFKKDLKSVHKMLHSIGLDSLGTANDVNRNVICTSNPIESELHHEVYEWAKKISEHLLPQTKAYAEIWLDKKKISTTDHEPILSKTYLPRKFKTSIVIPPHNDVDLHANDMNFIAIAEKRKLVGFNVLIGGGLSIEHGNKNTWPSCAIPLGFIPINKVLSVSESIVTTQRDWGNRTNRKNAKTRYTLHRVGFHVFKKEVEKRAHITFDSIRPYYFTTRGDRFGWIEGIDNKWHFTVFIPNGRIIDNSDQSIKSALAQVARIHKGDFRLTANQNIIIAGVDQKDKKEIENIFFAHGMLNKITELRKNSMACVSFPTCPLAMAEAERKLPFFITQIEKILLKYNMEKEKIVFRITGCPNGCGRSLLAEIGLIGKSPGHYNLYLGGNHIGTRIAKIYAENCTEKEILDHLEELIKIWSEKRDYKEYFGDFVIRFGIVKAVINSETDFWIK